MTTPEFSFIIVSYKNSDSIEACLGSIEALTTEPFEIIVVDNSPDDRTLNIVKSFRPSRKDFAVRIIERKENVGFSRACNLGASHASGRFLFFLNPDSKLMNDAATLLRRCLEARPRALAAGPSILDSAGGITRTCRNLPNLGRIILDATGLDSWFGAYKLTRFGHDSPKRVEQIIGAAMLVRRADYDRLGGMDERFFIYFEEVDFCKRLLDAGGEIWFWPEARVQHISGGSCEVNGVRARMIYTLRESRRKYFKKHYGACSSVALELINRLEGLEKALILGLLWLVRGERSYREKAYGFWAVATGCAPRPAG
jgi:GT2 family glycosyltransferase